ncbi:hypothetical protein Cgig2_019008 [Carnegiea gigantea]|uniref:Uncharacterized protein n=1 Tax=Carnegiea gigantea TaxID=171969 RepID=A0A9Q1GU52_9CARY|nr:hypothetical protein Cgig2_019008 [Carnegiea gigantea]
MGCGVERELLHLQPRNPLISFQTNDIQRLQSLSPSENSDAMGNIFKGSCDCGFAARPSDGKLDMREHQDWTCERNSKRLVYGWKRSAVCSSEDVLVALYEQNQKPSSAIEFVQRKLGGPSVSEYEKLKAEMTELQVKYNELLAAHEETCRQLEQCKSCSTMTTSEETVDEKPQPHRAASHEGPIEEPLH